MFKPARYRHYLALIAALLLTGCVEIYLVGHTEDWSDYTTGKGTADPLGGEGSAEFSFAKLGITCSGKFRDYAHGKARGRMLCSDGRVIQIESEATSMSGGRGVGVDEYGNRGDFLFFTGSEAYEEALARIRTEVERRNKDVAHLRALRPKAEAAPVTAPSAPLAYAPPPAPQPRPLAAPPVSGGQRLALVIGNGAYREAPLKNPVNDARALSAKLRALGFEVMLGENLGQREMSRMVVQFGERLAGRDVGMFFFAGHGIQIKGKNYLIPVDALIRSENSVRAETVDVDAVLDQLTPSPLNVVILDACRNNPFERRFRSVSGGLAQMDAPKGTLIAYATSPGKVALDGEGENSTYTTALLRALGEPGLPLESVFKRVRGEVARMTGDLQVPWEASSLTGDFFFSGMAAAPPRPAAETELLFWQSVKDSQDADDFLAYLRQFPEGRFVEIARNRINRMKGGK
ncbi:MAG: caspase family protein [Betaproteobacteria bacterium]|nr:caspase family protein [Betaproteobacteria bacterium]